MPTTSELFTGDYVCRVLRLTLLSPDLVEAILDGQEPQGLKLPLLMQGVAVEWERQHLQPFRSGEKRIKGHEGTKLVSTLNSCREL